MAVVITLVHKNVFVRRQAWHLTTSTTAQNKTMSLRYILLMFIVKTTYIN